MSCKDRDVTGLTRLLATGSPAKVYATFEQLIESFTVGESHPDGYLHH